MSVVKVSQKGWVVIPAELRRRYGWKPGTRVNVVDYGGVISLQPVLKNPEEEGWGTLKKPGSRSLLTALKEARAEERKLERWREKARK
ncbi:MAG: AbrB/MazE/SpoVT family DNA-binding domain-containing protein [Acidobacteria bacterium]|nr:AbrB/MazE/SpoVT family DNA-binding domain-containing protein [Acidobacteriota bacterium]